jgi:hypothetical protein
MVSPWRASVAGESEHQQPTQDYQIKTAVRAAITVATTITALAFASPGFAQADREFVPGTYYSAQNPKIPPLPFNPFPDLPVEAVGPHTYVYDDTSIDYDAMRAQRQQQMMAMDGAGMDSPESSGAVCATLRFDSTGAVLYWCSKTNAFYQIDFTPTLTDPTWFTLVDGYPSHGTNTFWKDVGYWQLVNNPKEDPIRFYRIVEKTNSATPPTVTLTVPPGALSGAVSISVSVASTPAILGAALYFDGERVDEIDGSGTFTVDTTQFTNGQHTIFATAENQSGFESTDEGTNNTVNTAGYGLSPFVTRTVNNAGFGPAGA